MNGKILAQEVIKKYGTSDVFAIAKQAEVPIIYQKWHPSTLGEFNRKTQTIYINLNTDITPLSILAHELAHFFINQENPNLNKAEEEQMAEDFAKVFL